MNERGTSEKSNRRPVLGPMGKSIFPTFDVNVPMPKDTAVPGSHKPAQPSSSIALAKTVEAKN